MVCMNTGERRQYKLAMQEKQILSIGCSGNSLLEVQILDGSVDPAGVFPEGYTRGRVEFGVP